MMLTWRFAAPMILVALSCGPAPTNGTGNDPRGLVLRGPVMPVCRVGVPCDAPFSALFHVWQGEAEVAQFTSDSTGRFRLDLADGGYVVVPDSSAPVIDAAAQRRAVTIAAGELIPDTLAFDTGIR